MTVGDVLGENLNKLGSMLDYKYNKSKLIIKHQIEKINCGWRCIYHVCKYATEEDSRPGGYNDDGQG